MNVNKLTINWTPEVGRTFVACVNVVEKLSSHYLLDKLMEKPSISVDITKGISEFAFSYVIIESILLDSLKNRKYTANEDVRYPFSASHVFDG